MMHGWAGRVAAPTPDVPGAERLCRLHRGDHPAASGPARDHLGPGGGEAGGLAVSAADVRDGRAHGSSTVVEGDCAPTYLEVSLDPLGALRLLGLPMSELSGQLVDLVEVLGADGRRLGE